MYYIPTFLISVNLYMMFLIHEGSYIQYAFELLQVTFWFVYVSSFLHWRFIYNYFAVLLVWKNNCILLCLCLSRIPGGRIFFLNLGNKDFELKLKGTERDSHDPFCERGQRLQTSLQRRLNINCNYTCTIPSL